MILKDPQQKIEYARDTVPLSVLNMGAMMMNDYLKLSPITGPTQALLIRSAGLKKARTVFNHV
ncbi:hypothetical protein PHLH7_36400 [Pseudomonas sp. Ost2]|uniref:hypothetical protein n=1 Tax=Pseudomonas sp. Ost2 TaxID=2678260 RepID=UPI001BB31C0B|nr:hypothetical protein [Pseudomonas sp. Ost2]BBP77536.1 hypothetical protein PHLH7_36400 [Pseudomonas sp. Ost2]